MEAFLYCITFWRKALRMESELPFERGGPGHARLLQSGSQLLQGPVPAQVSLGVRVEALFDPDVGPGLAPQMLGRFGEPRSFSAQRGALHFYRICSLGLLSCSCEQNS